MISCSVFVADAAKEKKVSGSYTYYLPYNVARDKAEQIALERAKIEAIAGEFGTVLTQHSRLDLRSSTFRSGDNCYLAFTTPVKGAIVVYLEDENGDVFCMLPYYYAQSATCTPVTPGERHIFFTSNDGDREKYRLLTDKEIERNTIYVVFSQNDFIKPIDKSDGHELSLKTLSSDNFRNWLQKSRALDHTFQVVTIPITITSSIE